MQSYLQGCWCILSVIWSVFSLWIPLTSSLFFWVNNLHCMLRKKSWKETVIFLIYMSDDRISIWTWLITYLYNVPLNLSFSQRTYLCEHHTTYHHLALVFQHTISHKQNIIHLNIAHKPIAMSLLHYTVYFSPCPCGIHSIPFSDFILQPACLIDEFLSYWIIIQKLVADTSSGKTTWVATRTYTGSQYTKVKCKRLVTNKIYIPIIT